MCGILGFISFNNNHIQQDNFKAALDLMSHRGPDDSGLFQHGRVMFGHRRLSIIDLDVHAKQPMVSACGNYILTFNGEIYNYKELREDLVKKGYNFMTSGDSEVLLNAFIEFGIDAVKMFIGMFAFSIYDIREDCIYVVRDRLGVKPLYYVNNKNRFIFSSEIKSILHLEDRNYKLNLNAVSSYLSYRYPILNDTFFEGIDSLPPAHYVKIKNNKVEFHEYWSAIDAFNEQTNDRGEKYYIERLRDLLESSVKYRMISDVPFGAFLSGGVDSSIITGLMAANLNEPVKTFTIGFNESGYNEFEYANIIAQKFKTDHHEIVLSGKDYVKTMEELIKFKDAPLSVPNEVPLYLMSKELKKYITVVLSGEGADEIFGGYGRIFRSPYDYYRLKNIDNLNLTNQEKDVFVENFLRKYSQTSFNSELDHFTQIYSYTSYDDKKNLLNEEAFDLTGMEDMFYNKFKRYFNELGSASYYNKLMYTFEKVHILGLLHRVDMTTMATSVEARVPFVDHRLVEFAFTIPVKYKLKWNENLRSKAKLLMSDKISEQYDTPKYILKKAYDDMIPSEVLYRKKMGFPVPLNDWFGGEFNSYAKEILLSKASRERGLYNLNNIEDWLSNNRLSEDHGFAMKIWMLVNLELFIQKYFK